MQYFKGDDNEKKIYESGKPILDNLSLQKDEFLEDAYAAAVLGDVLYDSKRSPLANAIAKNIFRISFSEVFAAFVVAGTFESYITVFKKIFGDDVGISFTVPAAGKLNIDITATGVELSPFVARKVVDNAYVFDHVVDDELDQIVFQTIKGFTSQYELEQMLFEMVPAGIFTNISLDLA